MKRIRLGHSDSAFSTNVKNNINVDIKRHVKLFPFQSVSDAIDQREVFEHERAESNKYRLILTINPFCTNILFNQLTEIVKNEETEERVIVKDDSNITENGAYGKQRSINRTHMIRNTEFSRPEMGYIYHCGYDIFNNHILRNKTFKVVNQTNKRNDNFNTISDTMRFADGNDVPLIKRQNNQNRPKYITNGRHLYISDDIMDITDSINTNLHEENGWFGFINKTNIETKKRGEDMGISHIINYEKGCRLIDMYPDRTLFSFNPKYNSQRNREEYNWDICITYPYKNFYKNNLITNVDGDGETNALLIDTVEVMNGVSDEKIVMFKTYIRHGLSRGDEINLYFNNGQERSFTQFRNTFTITNVGNFNGNEDYYFYVRDINSFLEGIGLNNESPQDKIDNFKFRVARIVNGVQSTYYFRIFHKIPNLKQKHKNLNSDIVSNDLENYIRDNAMKNEKEMLPFTRETYPLAFSKTIYGDNITQVTFTDTIDVSYLKDNLHRPLSELFITIIKRNKGHNKWYGLTNADEDIEYSHCFGKVSDGVEICHRENASESDRFRYAGYSDISLLNNLGCYNSKPLSADDKGITIENNEFYGDIVEYNGVEAIERKLTDVMFRFNTQQREMPSDIQTESFIYDEIISDDFDLDDFKLNTINIKEINGTSDVGGVNLSSIQRPEGYYYKPHFSIKIKSVGRINQKSHYEVKIKDAQPIQNNGIFIKVTSTLFHGLNGGNKVILMEEETGITYETSVADILSRNIFTVSVPETLNWLRLCDGLNEGKIKLLKKNTAIPEYAVSVGKNNYIWRDLEENSEETIFANGCFYLTKGLNFFLQRQDPFGEKGIYTGTSFPNDVFGTVVKTNNYEYKGEETKLC